MRKTLISTVAAVTMALTVVTPSFAGPGKGDKMIPLNVGEVFNNEYDLDLKDLEGFVVVVEFWATWCGPCRQSIPHLNQLHKQYKDDGVVFIGLSDEPAGTVKGFMGKMDMDYIVVSGSTSVTDYGVNGIPHAFLVDPTGKIVWNGHPMDEKFEGAIEQTLGSTPPTRRLGSGPEWNARLLDRMEKSMRSSDYAAIVKDLNRIDEKSIAEKKDHQKRYDAIRTKVETTARSEFERAESKYQARSYVEAFEAFEAIAKDFRGLVVADKAAERVKQLERDPDVQAARRSETVEKLAQNALKRADLLAERGMDVLAYKKYQSVVEKYPGAESAEEAQKKIDAYEADEEFMKKLKDGG